LRASLVEMKSGQSGVIVEIMGGPRMIARLDALGFRLNKRVRKVSSMMMRGPVVAEVDGFRIAIGYGMALRIIVEVMA